MFTQREAAREACIERPVAGSDTDVPAREIRPIGSVVPVLVQFAAGQNVERPGAVVAVDGRKSKIAEELEQWVGAVGSVRGLQQGISHYFVPLVERRQRLLTRAADLTVWLEIAVVVQRFVLGFAEGVVESEADVVGEALVD